MLIRLLAKKWPAVASLSSENKHRPRPPRNTKLAISESNGEPSLVQKKKVRGVWFDERCFSQLKSDRTGNHFTVGVKNGQPPFLFSRCQKSLGTSIQSVDRFIAANYDFIQRGCNSRRLFFHQHN